MCLPHTHTLLNQKGQASIFILALMGVVLVSAVFLYQSGRLTSEKMQLQNAADAAAFGASTLEARSLNFCAYTNRAMVANEVAIGQMVGMLSMADEIKSLGEYLQAYATAIEIATAWLFAVIVVGDIIEGIITVVVEVLEEVGEVIEEVGETIEKVLDVIATPVVTGLSINNEVYSVSQTLYHGATMVLVTTNMFKSLEDNTYGSSFNFFDLFKRNRKGAQVSDLGLIALAMHMPSYWSGYTKRYSSKKSKKEGKEEEQEEEDQDIEMDEFDEDGQKIGAAGEEGEKGEKKGDKKKKDKDNGMGRMAATVREARDPFSSGGDPIRIKNFLGMEVEYKNRDWFLGLEFEQSISILGAKFSLEESIGVRSKGGSEVRQKGDTFVWSGLDTLLGGPGFKYEVDIPHLFHTKGDVEAGIPLGGGISQAVGSSGGGGEDDEEGGGGVENVLTPLDFIDVPEPFLTMDPYAYGEAGKGERLLMADIASVDLEDNQVSSYSGLKAYRDRPDDKAKEDPKKPPVIPFQSPFFLVGLTRQMNDITDQGPQFSEKFDLIHDDDNKIIDRMGVIAKSQVYFSRPTDLLYFLRKDRKEEKSNVFSPFWQARLVDTTNLDRILALALQEHVIWLSGNIQDDVPGLSKIIKFLEDIFSIFR